MSPIAYRLLKASGYYAVRIQCKTCRHLGNQVYRLSIKNTLSDECRTLYFDAGNKLILTPCEAKAISSEVAR